jgi:RNA polymerase sigma-70 factor (sigma-E family)
MDAAQSFEKYVRGRGAALFRVAYVLTGDHHRAEDLTQETLLRLAGRWRRVVATGDPDGYARRILYNQHVSGWRRTRRRVTEVSDDPAAAHPAAPDRSDEVVAALLVRDALRRLAPRQRAVLVLRYYEDLSEARTAEILGIRVGTVKRQVRDALARLRSMVPGLLVPDSLVVDRPDRPDRIDVEITP